MAAQQKELNHGDTETQSDRIKKLRDSVAPWFSLGVSTLRLLLNDLEKIQKHFIENHAGVTKRIYAESFYHHPVLQRAKDDSFVAGRVTQPDFSVRRHRGNYFGWHVHGFHAG